MTAREFFDHLLDLPLWEFLLTLMWAALLAGFVFGFVRELLRDVAVWRRRRA